MTPVGLDRPPEWIATDRGLERLVRKLASQTAIAVDSESNPLYAYRERLCLLQISTKTRDYLIDPLAELDVGRLAPIFADPGILKIFHDAEFDVLMLKRTYPFELSGIFDTKVAAMSLGLPNIGLAPILEEFYGVTLDKRMQRSDWGKRPLTEQQLEYARMDTHFLLPLAQELRTRLREKGGLHTLEVASECVRVSALIPEPRPFDADEFVKIKGSDLLSPQQRRVLRELYVLRHEISDKLDRPAFKVLTNEMLLNLATACPTSDEQLKSSKILSAKMRERRGAQALAVIRRALELDPIPRGAQPKSENSLNDEQRGVYEALRSWRRDLATSRDSDAALILPRPTMMQLSRLRPRPRTIDELQATGLLELWRVTNYGDGILAALATSRKKSGASRRGGRR